MLLAVDAGNTQTVVGLYDLDGGTAAGRRPEAGLLDHWRISTAADRTGDEYAVMLQGFLALRRNSFSDVDGIVISSGVPQVTATLRQVTARHLDFEPIVIGPGVRSGIRIDYDNPKEVGADRIAINKSVEIIEHAAIHATLHLFARQCLDMIDICSTVAPHCIHSCELERHPTDLALGIGNGDIGESFKRS